MTSRPSPSYWAREVALRNKQEEVISDLQDNGLAKTMDKLASAIAQVAEEVKGANITLHFGAKIGERKQKGPVEEGGVSETSNPKRQRKD
jgi:microcystin degradation protein MlrC